MASVTGSSMSMTSLSGSFKQTQAPARICCPNSMPLSIKAKGFLSLNMRPVSHRFQVSCAAKPETVNKVCEIVRKQLALPAETAVTGESKFAALGADSLDTVEIVMGLEEAFDITVQEDNAQTIATVQDAADLIEDLVMGKGA
ncbi:acyl carrier protein 1, chloroplastic-like [Actinidia eriantha]|uniref:acyl carrier protein 1, chloroplastic-like n=1 Tax=Actinidia eriantha TaxID=165200 RepID=UPI0025829B63|nr:acyl carrier protein 1, chloroplastic-like [Actinidia eriantha]